MSFLGGLFSGLGTLAQQVAPAVATVNPTAGLGMGLAGGMLAGDKRSESAGSIVPAVTGNTKIAPTTREIKLARAAGASGASGAAGAAGSVIASQEPWAKALWDIARVNGISPPSSGGNRKVTCVFTLNNQGEVDVRQVEAGHPLIMSRDAQKMRRVIRQINKLEKRVPRRTVKQSKSKQLAEAVTETALAKVRNGDHHHHNGG